MMLLVEDVDSDDDDDDDDDHDFIEVADKEGFEPTIPEHQHEEYGFAAMSTVTFAAKPWQQKYHLLDIEDPTSLVASVMKRQQLEQEKVMTKLGHYIVYHLSC